MRDQVHEGVLRGVVGRVAIPEDVRTEAPDESVEAHERPLEHGAVTLAGTRDVRAQLLSVVSAALLVARVPSRVERTD